MFLMHDGKLYVRLEFSNFIGHIKFCFEIVGILVSVGIGAALAVKTFAWILQLFPRIMGA